MLNKQSSEEPQILQHATHLKGKPYGFTFARLIYEKVT